MKTCTCKEPFRICLNEVGDVGCDNCGLPLLQEQGKCCERCKYQQPWGFKTVICKSNYCPCHKQEQGWESWVRVLANSENKRDVELLVAKIGVLEQEAYERGIKVMCGSGGGGQSVSEALAAELTRIESLIGGMKQGHDTIVQLGVYAQGTAEGKLHYQREYGKREGFNAALTAVLEVIRKV